MQSLPCLGLTNHHPPPRMQNLCDMSTAPDRAPLCVKNVPEKESDKSVMPSLYLVRHASPDWNRKDIPYHLPPGPPLTEQGLAEAHALGQFLRLANVQQLWTSPLGAMPTHGRDRRRNHRCIGKVDQQLREWQPQESKEALRDRTLPVVDRAWQWVAQQNGAGGTIALVTHGGPIMTLLSALGIDDRTMESLRIYDHRNPVPPAGVWELNRQSLGQSWEMRLVFTPEAIAA